MTTLDKTEIETARDEFVHSLTKEQIERWAYKWADDLLSTAIALSSIPEQPVGWKLVPIRLTPEMGHALESNIAECAEPSEVHQENWANAWHQAVLLAPQPPPHPAAVAVTDEIGAAGMIRVCPERDARCPHGVNCPFGVGEHWYTCDMAASRAALVDRDRVK